MSSHVLLSSIPSPPGNAISLGPVDLRAYGFLIACGVLAGVWLAGRRLAEDGLDPEIIPSMAMWVLPAGIVGARAYFVLTNWHRYADDPAAAFQIWKGGLGIPGGVLAGVLVGVWWMRRYEVASAPVFTAVGLALPLGQIIGRFGNWFNQELYGRPTDLPWGLEIDPDHRLAGYESFELFHPTFAYEILWNVGLFGFLWWVDRKRVLRPGALFAVYLIGYGIGRTLIELVRIDPVNEFLGVRMHIWAMVVFMAAAAVYLARWGFVRGDGAVVGDTVEAVDGDDVEAVEVDTRDGGADGVASDGEAVGSPDIDGDDGDPVVGVDAADEATPDGGDGDGVVLIDIDAPAEGSGGGDGSGSSGGRRSRSALGRRRS